MGFWKVVGWIFLIWFLLASGFWVFAAIYWGIKHAPDPRSSAAPTGADVLAAGYIGYQLGRRHD